ncbi:MAG: DUF3048 domain-containing protein [Lachnospiraceae bacterium]|nr:DUF3048 domain-containing protein [Lachnospiraceae bacterium]
MQQENKILKKFSGMLKKGTAGFLALLLCTGMIGGVKLPVQAAGVDRNTTFTSMADVQEKLGVTDGKTWSPVYITEVESYYWNFADSSELGGSAISLNLAKNAYRNLEMLLDNGYTMDYNTLAAYCAEYLGKKAGVPDSFYNVMADCLNNPYLLNRPAATVTATTYNGRDYSRVFDATYYYNNNPDLQSSIGNNPAELLRQFVEQGINEGRRGNASFDILAYVKQVDAEVLASEKISSAYTSLKTPVQEPLGRYSYSYANYYGKYLNHYTAADLAESTTTAESTRVTTGIYHENSAKSVYTNEATTADKANLRPLAVMMPTDLEAQPSYGIGQAEVLYEIMEEGNISRQMAIIPGWTNLSRIGNLRSCRLYYIPIAKEWDPILIHFGGVAYMKGTIDGPDVNNISGTYEYGTGGKAPGAGFFFRSTDRTAPHNAYISADGVKKACTRLGYQTSLRDAYYNAKHFTFAERTNTLSQYGADAMSATKIDLSKVFSYTKSTLTYNAADGLYYKNLHGKAQVDARTGKQLTFANVVVQNTTWSQLDKKGYLSFNVQDNTQDGYYFTKGKCIHITWQKGSDYSPTIYYDDNGQEVEFNTGKTYIAIAQDGKDVIFQ